MFRLTAFSSSAQPSGSVDCPAGSQSGTMVKKEERSRKTIDGARQSKAETAGRSSTRVTSMSKTLPDPKPLLSKERSLTEAEARRIARWEAQTYKWETPSDVNEDTKEERSVSVGEMIELWEPDRLNTTVVGKHGLIMVLLNRLTPDLEVIAIWELPPKGRQKGTKYYMQVQYYPHTAEAVLRMTQRRGEHLDLARAYEEKVGEDVVTKHKADECTEKSEKQEEEIRRLKEASESAVGALGKKDEYRYVSRNTLRDMNVDSHIMVDLSGYQERPTGSSGFRHLREESWTPHSVRRDER